MILVTQVQFHLDSNGSGRSLARLLCDHGSSQYTLTREVLYSHILSPVAAALHTFMGAFAVQPCHYVIFLHIYAHNLVHYNRVDTVHNDNCGLRYSIYCYLNHLNIAEFILE
jgi:hypothetical protein